MERVLIGDDVIRRIKSFHRLESRVGAFEIDPLTYVMPE